MRQIRKLDQHERGVVFAENLKQWRSHPPLIAKLDRVAEVLRQGTQERVKSIVKGRGRIERLLVEVRELEDERARLLTERTHRVEEQSRVVADFLGHQHH